MKIQVMNDLTREINNLLGKYDPWKIALVSSITAVAGFKIFEFLLQDESLHVRAKKFALRNLRKIPQVRKKIEEEMEASRKRMEKDLLKLNPDTPPIWTLPNGQSIDDVVKLATLYKKHDRAEWSKLSGTVYSGEKDLTQLVTAIYNLFAFSNPLHPDVFPSVRQMEAEVVRICCSLFNGDSETCGSMTSGGTESIFMACKAYRDLARSKGIEKPIIVAPVTAHAAFDKAAQYLGMTIVHVQVDPVTYAVDVKAMERAISRRTCMLVASAPQFPHGIIDPVSEVAALGQKYEIPVHVDSCLGGFLLPFMEKAGFQLQPFDFRVPGVTSISADPHKYGYTPKGASVVMYRHRDYQHHQYYVSPDWPGGIYASPSISGSRVGANIAVTWATLLYVGLDGYVEATRDIINTARKIYLGIATIPGLYVLGHPRVSVVSFASDLFNIYRLSDGMSRLGWNLNALQFPSSIHICVTRLHTREGVVEKFLGDLRTCVEEIMKTPDAEETGMAAIYGMAQSIPDRSVVSEIAWTYLDACVALPPSEAATAALQ